MSTGLKANNDGSAAIQVGGSDFLTVTSGGNTTFTQAANLPNTFGFKNRIINGAMVIDQRNAGASVVVANNNAYVVDRFRYLNNAGSVTCQQSATAPAGFINSILLTVGSTNTPGAADFQTLRHVIEGLNVTDFAWGTASATPITISFWVRSSVTGTYSVGFRNSAVNRAYVGTYTISAANTFEYKTITVPGDTSGTWLTTNGVGIYIDFSLGTGSNNEITAGSWQASSAFAATGEVNWISNAGATFYITGVQLEKGSTATSFDYRPYSTELQLAQRYYYRVYGSQTPCSGTVWSTSLVLATTRFPVTMRTNPTALEQSGTAAHYNVLAGGVVTTCNGVPTLNSAGDTFSVVAFATGATLVAGQGAMGNITNTSGYLGWSAEL